MLFAFSQSSTVAKSVIRDNSLTHTHAHIHSGDLAADLGDLCLIAP